MMSEIRKYLRAQYFLGERDSNNLLLQSESVSVEGVSSLILRMKDFYGIYLRNRELLNKSTRDTPLKDTMESHKDRVDEYLYALQNYDKYADLYDVSKTLVLGTETF